MNEGQFFMDRALKEHNMLLEKVNGDIERRESVVIKSREEAEKRLGKLMTTHNPYETALQEACIHLANILVRKNRDYKNSYVDTVNNFGDIVPLIRINDKFSRLKTLVLDNLEAEVKDERIEDTLLDMAGYSILEYTRRNS